MRDGRFRPSGHEEAATITEQTLDPTPLERGRAALERGAWEDALAVLEQALRADPDDAAAWESLAYACTWLQDPRAIDARQRAYACYRELGDDVSAARVSLDLVYDFVEIVGEPAVANGWLQRARRLLEGRPPTAELAVLKVWDAYFAVDADPAVAEPYARTAVEIARSVGAADVGALALAVHGLVLVNEGKVSDGMRLLDEAIAAAIGREITDPQWYYFACCCMIDACDSVRDFSRSLSWCDQLRAFAERWRVPAFLTTCRVKYSAALLWRGDWHAYETQLERAIEEMSATRPAGVPGAAVRLAELRRRQGRRDDAEALIRRADDQALALHVRAALALDAGDALAAIDLVDTMLRRTAATARTERVAALELKAAAHASLGSVAEARKAADELASIATVVDTKPMRASALVAEGLVAAAESDYERAKHCFEDAAYLLEQSGSRYEAARARLHLAGVLARLGRTAAATAAATAALESFDRLGAEPNAARARELLADIDARGEAASAKTHAAARTETLTARQRDVLGLVAQGLSDSEIAKRLFLSEHTVHRHVANILTRLGVPSRTAAVAKALRLELL